jgi:hypothetical protein
LLEEEVEGPTPVLASDGTTVELAVRPFEVVTLRVTQGPLAAQEADWA